MNGDQFFRKTNRIKAILVCIFIYFLVTMTLTLLFACVNMGDSYQKKSFFEFYSNSWRVFWGLGSRWDWKYEIQETIISHFVDILFSALMVKVFMEDIGQLLLLDSFCIDSDKKELVIGYCYRTDPAEFLYNVDIIVQLLRYRDIKSGRSDMRPLYEKKFQYYMVRGVRYVELPLESDLRYHLKRLSCSGENEEDTILRCMIKGQNGSGGCVSNIKHYFLRDCFNGYRFVSIQRRGRTSVGENGPDYTEMRFWGRVKKCDKDSLFKFKTSGVLSHEKEKLIITQKEIDEDNLDKILDTYWKFREFVRRVMKR